MKKETDPYLFVVKFGIAVFFAVAVLMLIMCLYVDNKVKQVESIQEFQSIEPEPQWRFISIDESTGTGFMSCETIEARYETYEFPIAGTDDVITIYDIDIRRYPCLEWTQATRKDSFEEAVDFLMEVR